MNYMNDSMKKHIDELYEKNNLSDEKLLYILNNIEEEEVFYLQEKALKTKEKYYGKKIEKFTLLFTSGRFYHK